MSDDALDPVPDEVLDLVSDYFAACAGGREPALDDLCAGRPDLRKSVAYAIADSRRARAALCGGGPNRPPPAAGVAGRFGRLRFVARGGMGEVYRAVDEEAAREVAYKVVLPRSDCGLFRTYLLNEARLTAALAHPAIVPVYAVVRDGSGRPAYAMEFIDGETLYDAVERGRAAPPDPAAPGLRALVAHVVAVGRAVGYAHANGVSHGDIKANNVRIRSDGKPFVIDWGLARRHPGGVPARDTAADVARLARLLDYVLGDDGVPPALAATRAAALGNRYLAADALADALQQWLDTGGTPDYRDYWTVRAVRWASRWPATATAVAAGLLLAVAAAGAVVWYRAEREEVRAAEAAKALEQAEKEKGLLREIVRGNEAEAAAVRDIVAQAEVLGRFQASVSGGRRQLDIARGHLTQLVTLAEKDPARAGEAADLLRQCGRLAFVSGDIPRAAGDYDAARQQAEAAFRREESPANRVRLAKVLREWGVTRANQWRAGDARAAWDEAFKLLEPLPAADPDAKFTRAQLHMVCGNVGATVAEKKGQFGQARRLMEELLRETPKDHKYRFTLAEVLNNGSHLAEEDVAKRETNCRRAVAIWQELVAEQPDRPETKAYLAASLNHLANACRLRTPAKLAEAEALYREAIGIYQALVLAFPGVASNRDELRDVEKNLGALTAARAGGGT